MHKKSTDVKRLIFCFFLPLIALFCSYTSATENARINIFNAEDLAPLDGGQWIIASSMAGGLQNRGGLYAVNVHDGTTYKIYPQENITQSTRIGSCSRQVAAAAFAPHGIALRKDLRGTTFLYVVNHGERESIEIFEVEQKDKPSARWAGCAIAPEGVVGNAIAVTAEGVLYMTNMGKPLDGSTAISSLGGNIVMWTEATGWQDVSGSGITAPNGLLLSGDGRTLYVASWTKGQVISMKLTGDTRHPSAIIDKVSDVKLLPDNLRWSSTGTIFAVGHRASVEAVIACFYSPIRCSDPIPSAIAEIDPLTLAIQCSRSIDHNMATSAVNVGNEVWFGAARGDSILRLPSDAIGRPNCESP